VNDSKEVQLLINARLKGGRDLDTIRKSIADLEKAIDSQADAARRGESSYEGLKAAAAALATVQEELAARGKVVRQFEDTTRAVERQTAAVEKARKKLADYQAKTADGRTDAQQEKVQALERSYQNAQARLESFQRSISTIGAALRETGANTDQLSSVTARLADEELAAAAAQKRVNEELRNYVDTVNKARAATKQLGDEQAKLARLQQGNEDDARIGREQRKLELLQQQTTQAGLLARLQTGNENDALLGRQQAAARATQDTGLKKQADDAERAARPPENVIRNAPPEKSLLYGTRLCIRAIENGLVFFLLFSPQ
jgi:vacuolar-type H+-ATPase subunit I/STV1